MIDADFGELRAAARRSAMGHAVAGVMAAVTRAADDAAVTRVLSARLVRFWRESPDARVRWGAVTLAIAAVSTLALSRMVPPYLSTFIPASGFVVATEIFGAAAAAPHLVVQHWEGSSLRRLTHWLFD
ncbi:MAG: hypothetical protein ACKOEC_01760 [Acidimicrobiia bacterium]